MQELLLNLERLQSLSDNPANFPLVDFPGVCLNNTPSAAKDLPNEYSEALMKGCDDEAEGEHMPSCSSRDAAIAKKMKLVYGRYLFVFSAVNNIENTSDY
jgi:hypothetical protein